MFILSSLKINCNNLKKYLKYHENIEKIIAMAKDKIPNHEKNGTNCNFYRYKYRH